MEAVSRLRHRVYPFSKDILALGAAIALIMAAPAHAGSTGSASPLTPQGNGGGTANGDFISSSGTGRNTFYRYFIEVPSGISRLVVEIFDADVGAGGAGDASGGRDRDRLGYDTSVNYSLLDPTGTARTTRFTTGNNAGPAGADNAWLTLYSVTGNSVEDNFGTAAFSNNDGNNNWAASWIETDGGGAGAAAGAIRVTGGELRLQDGVGGTPSLARQADLLGSPGLDLAAAYLTFNYRTSNNLESGDQISIQVSNNGGGSWTTLATFSGNVTGTANYDITSSIANNTQIRFLLAGGYSGDEFFYVDNVRITDGEKTAGHWELRVDMSSSVTTGDDINAIGIRAHDGTSGSGGTELNVYYDSHNQHGVNPPDSGTQSRSYDFHPYITSGCSASKNDFDHDSNSGTVGSMTFASRTGSFTQSYSSSSLSSNNVWRRDTFTGWTTDTAATDYGIWTADLTITSYIAAGVPNGNYANLWFGNYQAAANPPAANPTANAFRVYFPTDAGAAPAKPYLEQLLTHKSGTNPVLVGQTSRYGVTIRMANPSAHPITFSASNLVTANVPGGGSIYAGNAQVSQGTIVSQPSVGGTGNVTWNPGTLAAGATAILAYEVDVNPTSAGQRILATNTPASGNGTRAQYVDETGNTTQARATYLFGPICELGVTEGMLTEAVVSSFHAYEDGGSVVLEWQTASEAGTLGFELFRYDPAARRWIRLNEELLLGLLHAPQGGTYRFVDEGADPRVNARYRLVEVEVDGGRRIHGPFLPKVDWERSRRNKAQAMTGRFDRAAHPAAEVAEEKAGGPAQAVAEVRRPGEAIHLSVREPGLYYVASADIAQLLGISVDDAEALVGKGKLSLSRAGVPVAWFAHVVEDKKKRAPGLFFYGEGIDSLYTRDAVYKLESGRDLRMSTVRASGAAPGAAGVFTATVRAEQDRIPATAISPDPESDYWFWDFLQAGDATYGTKSFQLEVPGPAPGTAQGSLKVRLQGASTTGVAGEHHVTVRLNGTVLGEMRWEGIAASEATFPVAQELLRETGNQVEVAGLLDPGVPYSILYVDSFELSYSRLYRAAGDALAFGAAGNPRITVAGFSSPEVRLLEVSDPARPAWITGATVAAGATPADGYQVSFAPPVPAGRYVAAAASGVKAPVLRVWNDAGLSSRDNGAEYLVIAPAEMRSAAERLAALRRSQGLETLVVDLQAVMDEFNFGVSSPHALRAFLAHARSQWRTAPRYVALAGTGTLDYRDLLGYGGNVMPPLMVSNTGGLFASDNRIADADGDGLPEMAIGRIPVRTAAELDAYVDKIAAYESGTGDWAGNALLLADTTDRGADFAAASEEIAALLPAEYTVDRIYLSATPLTAARDQLFAEIQNGASLINYLGHGGLDRISSSGLLASADVAGLANGDRLPVLTAMTCAVNRFGVPGVPPLGEVLVKKSGGGAAAVWGPSGLSVHGEAMLLAERFYLLAAKPEIQRLGDLVLRSLTEFDALGGNTLMLDIYNLLGDPALRLRRAGPPPASVGSGSGE